MERIISYSNLPYQKFTYPVISNNMPLVFPFIWEYAYMYTFSELFEGQMHHDPLPLLRNVSGYE